MIMKNILQHNEIAYMEGRVISVSEKERIEHTQFRVGEAILDSLLKLGISIKNNIFQEVIYAISRSIAELALSKEKWRK